MKKVLCIGMALLLMTIASGVIAKETATTETVQKTHWTKPMTLEAGRSLTPSQLNAGGQPDTTFFGNWDFTTGPACDDQTWFPKDASEQIDDFWHIDDFAGLGGGTFGGLTPVEGTKSLWMGARPTGLENLDLCGYSTLPGYGNAWDQKWCTKTCLDVTTGLEVVFIGRWDSEPGYDGTTVQISTCSDGTTSDLNWLATRPIASPGGHFDGVSGVDSLVIEAVPDSFSNAGAINVQLRLLFHADGGWSDEDGLWDTDGAILVDSLVVNDDSGNLLPVELFEDEAVGATVATDWQSCNEVGFSRGNPNPNYADAFGNLYPALTLVQEDPCVTELDCVWAFIEGSLDNYACASPVPYPGQTAVPKGPNSRNQYISEEIWGPVAPFATTSTDIEVAMHVYSDIPLDNLVFLQWSVRSYVGGCPTNWRNDNFVYRDADKTWGTWIFDLGDKLAAGATEIQFKTGVRDMCAVWCGVFGTGACHSHGPLWDQIWLYAVEVQGPAFNWKAGGMPCDTFAEDGTTTGTARFDASGDILPSANPGILIGDSITIVVNDPINGLSTGKLDGSTWASVYAYIGVYDATGATSKYSAAQLSDDTFRWPVVDSVTAPDASKWYIVRLDTAFSSPGRVGVVLNTFCLDLNDALFVPGDEIRYFIAAESDNNFVTNYFYHMEQATDISASWAPSTTSDINIAFANYREITILPTQQLKAEPGDILFVDNWHGRGIQPYFDTAFDMLGILDKVDRYDTGQSGSSAAGWFGARVQDTFQQLIPVYRKIIWGNGTDQSNGVGDGTGNPIKADDWAILYTFVDQHPNGGGIYLTGDGLASAWENLLGGNAVNFKGVYMNFNVVTNDHTTIMGLNPLMIGAPGSCFDHVLGPDTMVAYGGCATIEMFDVLEATGNSVVEMTYDGNAANASILSQVTPNNAGDTARVMLSGVSFHQIRDFSAKGVPARSEHMFDVITWLQNTVQTPVGVKTAGLTNSLEQNYPNPFNPTTTIEYQLREQSPVQLKIYNVAGQLVRTLVNDVKAAGQVHVAQWDGRNDAGQTVSSGVYFYKLTSKNFVQTKKMVLLK